MYLQPMKIFMMWSKECCLCIKIPIHNQKCAWNIANIFILTDKNLNKTLLQAAIIVPLHHILQTTATNHWLRMHSNWIILSTHCSNLQPVPRGPSTWLSCPGRGYLWNFYLPPSEHKSPSLGCTALVMVKSQQTSPQYLSMTKHGCYIFISISCFALSKKNNYLYFVTYPFTHTILMLFNCYYEQFFTTQILSNA